MAQTYDYTGVVEEVGSVQTFTSGFTKREIIVGNDVNSNRKYENPVKFTFKKDGCSRLDDIKKGQRVTVQFAVDGRRWDGPKGTQYFVDLTGLFIQAIGENGSSASADCPPPATAPATIDDAQEDDIPF